MNYVYNILSISGLIAFVVASMIKGEKIKKNLFFVFTGSVLVGSSYLFTPLGINGAVSSFIGAAQAVINYFFSVKDKKIPIWLILLYVMAFLGINLAVIESSIGILALMASLCFVGSISAKNGKWYRIWQVINSSLWISYDFLSGSTGPLVTHSVLLCFTVIGMFINDFKKQEAKNENYRC